MIFQSNRNEIYYRSNILTIVIKNDIQKVVITPNPTRELQWTVVLFNELIGAGIYMFWSDKAPFSGLKCMIK